jgi:DNA invertase Pin-like site-specific DNA recombinase
LLALIESGVEVLFADLLDVSGAMAAVAELEAGLIGERTKAALAAAKQRGVRLGVTGAEKAERYKAEAQARANELAPVLRDLKKRGLSLRAVAAELTKRRVPTPRGGAWHPQLVKRIVERLDADRNAKVSK